LQRAGEYVLQWATELDAQNEKIFGGTAATKTTLVKRGPKSHAEDESGPPTKKTKVEVGASDMDDEIKRNWEKGTLPKVSTSTYIYTAMAN
jgi:ATP-dependent DNA helicase 2 subunit 1